MHVTCAMWFDEQDLSGRPAFAAIDADGNQIVTEGVSRKDLIQMFRNAFCANDAPSENEIEELPDFSRKMMHDIATKFLSYECVASTKTG